MEQKFRDTIVYDSKETQELLQGLDSVKFLNRLFSICSELPRNVARAHKLTMTTDGFQIVIELNAVISEYRDEKFEIKETLHDALRITLTHVGDGIRMSKNYASSLEHKHTIIRREVVLNYDKVRNINFLDDAIGNFARDCVAHIMYARPHVQGNSRGVVHTIPISTLVREHYTKELLNSISNDYTL